MTIPKELEEKILRLHFVEKWRPGTIANQLSVHHTTVERVLGEAGVPRPLSARRPSMADPFIPFITETLSKYPSLTAARIFEMVKERGYSGSSDGHFRKIVSRLRPRPKAEAYLRLRTLPGEQAQVDWGHFGHIEIGRAKRALMAFVMVLSFSRRVFLRFFLNQNLFSFLQGHVAAFEDFEGVPKVLLYDNLKSVVLERYGDAIRFHSTMLDCARHYRFEPRPVAPARGNEKGRVERAIRYIRQNFWPARSFSGLDDLNQQARVWCDTVSANRPCPDDRTMTVREAFEQEKPKLLSLPANPFPAEQRVEAKVGKTPYVRFDLNDYSVPHTRVLRTVTVAATARHVRIIEGTQVIASHERSFGKGEQIENPEHIEELARQKRSARRSRGMDRLRAAVPRSYDLLVAAADHGYSVGSITQALLRLLEQWGPAELGVAIEEALERGVPHTHAVRLALERRSHDRHTPPPMPVRLPDDDRIKNMTVQPHELSTYDWKKEEPDAGERDFQ